MIHHVLPGDAQASDFAEAGLTGEVIVFREALVTGPIEAETPDTFWDARARFILAEYAEDEIEFHEKVADEILRLDDVASGDEVNLWFEFELFCSVNYWFCLDQLRSSGAKVYRVAPVNASPDAVWDGFAGYNAKDLLEAFESRVELCSDDIETGAALWDAYRRRDGDALRVLGQYRSEAFPFLTETAEAAALVDVRPAEIVAEIIKDGKTDLEEVFVEFRKRAGVYGFGDVQVEAMLNKQLLG